MYKTAAVFLLLAVPFGCSSKNLTPADKFIETVGAEICDMLSKSECRVCRGDTGQENDFVDFPAESALDFRMGSMKQYIVTVMLYKGATALTPALFEDVKRTYDHLASIMLKAAKEQRPELAEESLIEAQRWNFHYSTGEVGLRALRLFGNDGDEAVLLTTRDGRWDILIVVPGAFRSGIDPLRIAHRIDGIAFSRVRSGIERQNR